MPYISEDTPRWYPASLEHDTSAISNKMKSPKNDVYDYYIILLESVCIIFIQKTFWVNFKKSHFFFFFIKKNVIFPKTEKLWLDENTLENKNTMLAIRRGFDKKISMWH